MASNSEFPPFISVLDTQVQLQNHCNDYIQLYFDKYLFGNGEAPKKIEAHQTGKFKADGAFVGSFGVVVYDFPAGKIKWIVAWSNPKDAPNKAYTNIVHQSTTINWDDIEAKLNKSGNQSSVDNVEGYTAEVVIDTDTNTPNLIGTLKPDA